LPIQIATLCGTQLTATEPIDIRPFVTHFKSW